MNKGENINTTIRRAIALCMSVMLFLGMSSSYEVYAEENQMEKDGVITEGSEKENASGQDQTIQKDTEISVVTEKQETNGDQQKEGAFSEFPPINKVTGISVTGKSHSLRPNRSMSLSAAVSPAEATYKKVNWSSDYPEYAEVSPEGVVTAKKAGVGKEVQITATAADGSGVSSSYYITIKRDQIKKIKLSLKRKSSGKYCIKAKIYGTGSTVSKKLKWSVSNNKYAKVTAKGVIKIKKAGRGHKVRITAKATDGSGVKASIRINIGK